MKNVLITGGTRGLGRRISVEFAKKGFNLALVYFRNQENANKTKKQLQSKYNVEVKVYCANLSQEKEVKQVFLKIKKDFKTIDVLINNAGYYKTHPNQKELNLIKNTKLIGVLSMTALAAKNNVKSIINITSLFSGSKFSSTARIQKKIELKSIEFAKKFIKKTRINCIRPGLTKGGTFIQNHTDREIKRYLKLSPDKKLVPLEHIAKTALFISTNSSITGQIVAVDKGTSLLF